MNPIVRSLRNILSGVTTTEQAPPPPVDLSPDCEAWRKVTRVVRPNDHVGTAFGGDRVLIDEAELAQPAVARALMTEEEFAEATKRQARAMLRLLGDEETIRRAGSEVSERRAVVARADEVLSRGRRRPERDLDLLEDDDG